MFGKHFDLNESTLSIVEEIGRHIPGGFFIYQAGGNEELFYANQTVFELFGCDGPEDFKQLTGYTFRGIVHPDDYDSVTASIHIQIYRGNLDYVEYRIIRKDGSVRWVDDYGHFTESDVYGGIYYVFVSDIMEIANMILTNMGFIVETAENGKAAVEMVAASEPGYYDAVLMDIQMPVMDGYTATKEIRALGNKALAGIPIVAMTANAFAEDVRACLDAGMQGHIVKPIDVNAMINTLTKLFYTE